MSYTETEKEEILNIIKNELTKCKNLPHELRGDKDFVLKVLALDLKRLTKYMIQDLSKELRDDKDVALVAVKKDGLALEELSTKLKSDKEVVLEAVRSSPYSLAFAANELKDCEEVVLQTVKSYRHYLKFASDRLKNNKEFVLKLIVDEGIDCIVLRHASETLQSDKDILEILEKKDISSWHISECNWYQERMQILNTIRSHEDKEFMEKAIINNSSKKVKKNKF